jgi:hypothetical protein
MGADARRDAGIDRRAAALVLDGRGRRVVDRRLRAITERLCECWVSAHNQTLPAYRGCRRFCLPHHLSCLVLAVHATSPIPIN